MSGVLVVDDEPKILSSIRDLLEDEFAVSTSTDAEDALQLLQQQKVAVIVSDQRMPGIAGDEFLMRASRVSQATRVLLTGYADMQALVRAVNQGRIYSYVAKPWDPLELKATISHAADHYALLQELAHERDLLHALMDNIPDMIYFKDTGSRFTRINRTEARLLGVQDPAEAVEKTEFDFLDREYARESRADEQKIVETARPLIDKAEKIRSADGQVLWISTTKVPLLGANGKVTGIAGISRDITQRRQAEEELARQAEQLARYNAELEEFAYVAAHDLQEPLRSVASFTQLLGQRYKGRLDADADKFIDLAVAGANRMKALINDLLVYSRVARRPSELKATDSEAAFQQALDSLRATVEESGASVTHDRLPTVLADPARLDQLFQNLLGNTLKFRGPAPPRVHVWAEKTESAWVFSVRDNGIGIDPEHLGRVFKIFERLHSKQQYPGTGIGLAVCKKIVESHGGRIWVESAPGRGATFRFTIPA